MSIPRTVSQYRSTVQNLRRQYEAAGGDAKNLSAFVGFCEGTFPSLMPATIRFYARSLEWHFSSLKVSPDEQLRQLHCRFVNLKFTTSARKQLELPKRTSSIPSKHCSLKKFEQILAAVSESHSQYGHLAQTWLVGGLLLGIRPCEWPSMEIDVEAREATVVNAKQQDGQRAFPGRRTIRLVNWSQDQISVLCDAIFLHNHLTQHLCLQGRTPDNAAKLICDGVRECIRKACRSLKDPSIRVSLYSLRHQCISNLRRGSWPLNIAVVMGHRVEATHRKHYGRVQTAQRPLAIIQASQKDIDTVQEIQKSRAKQRAWARRDAEFHALEAERRITTFSQQQLSPVVEEPTGDELEF